MSASRTRIHTLLGPRLQRTIGVTYHPETELMSHYLEINLPRQFDHYVWFDRTASVRPLAGKPRAGPPKRIPPRSEAGAGRPELLPIP